MKTNINQFNKPYDPKKVEDKIYRLWEKSGYFNPDKLATRDKKQGTRKNFCIIMPPTNANGSLHLGHAVFVTLQDIMIRYRRMKGDKTLWLPGADHAGFETQVVYDKKLEKEGRNRFQIPREQLYKKIWEFTQKNKKVMENQLRQLGASCDWSREKFTLDKDIVEIVYQTFRKLKEDGLLYQGQHIVNWCTKHQTALSELEVKYEERNDPLYYIKYGPIELATVRLETKFGDTAVAVNPKDKRYQKYIGKEIEIETLIGKARIKVIADEAVDIKFGTGAVKVTPAHDPVDFEIWQRHKNEIPFPKQVIDKYGRLNEFTGPYQGMKIKEAREKIAQNMAEKGLLDPKKTEHNYKHNVGVCYKCGTIIEPMILDNQWFIKMTDKPKSGKDSLRDLAVKAVKKGEVKFIPKRFEKIFFHWMKNLRDWNISRQIPWGIKIPASCMGCGDIKINPKIKSHWFVVRHGETDWNREGRWMGHLEIPLNKTGREQAMETARQLKNKNIDLVISSDLARCKETAEIIAKELKTELIFDTGLRERHGGIVQGMTSDERLEKLGDEEVNRWKTYKGKPEGGESWQDVEKRVIESIKNHKLKYAHKNLVVVTHSGPIRMLRKALENISFEESRLYPSPKNTEIIELTISDDKCKKCGSDLVEQDNDVFDTWFSSGQWPFATLGYPNSKDFKEFYPTTVMETGWDILFFWVARMIMLGLYVTGKVPFKYVYLHGMVRDKDRQKMSKSKGNVIDPLGVIDLYGADALRMALVVGNAPGNDPIIYEEKIRGYRNFANKIWQASRFVLMNTEDFNLKTKLKLSESDKKRLKELVNFKKEITKLIESFKFYAAGEKVYHYFWHIFADKVIESAKPRLKGENKKDRQATQYLLLEILKTNLKLLHPFMPFITEEIYQNLPKKPRRKVGVPTKTSGLLMIEKW